MKTTKNMLKVSTFVALIFCSSVQLKADNTFRTQFPDVPLWTDSLNWTTSVTITDFKLPEENDWDNALQKAFNQLDINGGTVFFPAGTYNFSNDVTLPTHIILRGETPVNTDAKSADFAPPSRLVFPAYLPTFTGDGTTNATAFKTIKTNGDVQNCAIVYLDINRGRILLGTTTASRNILVYGVRQNNVAQPDAGVPDKTYMNGWQRFSYRHTYNITVNVMQCAAINRCRVNDLMNNNINPVADDSYDQPGYVAKGTYINGADNPNGATATGTTNITHGERARFNYLNHYGIRINGQRMNPSINPVPINQQIELVDNWILTTMRVGYFAEGIGLVVHGNVKKDLNNKMAWLDATGKSLITYNGNTLENRGLNFAGENILIENNDFEVTRHKMVNTKYYSTDGEGIMIQTQDAWDSPSSGNNSRMRDVTIRNNRVTGYIGIYDVPIPISNVHIYGNDLRANEDISQRTDGTILIFKKEKTYRIDNLTIENNTNIGSISVGWKNTATNEYEMPGSNISIKNNVGVNRLGLNFPYQTIVSGNSNFTSSSTFATSKLLPVTQIPYQMQYEVAQNTPIYLEFKNPIEAINLSQIKIGRTSDGLVSNLTASIFQNKLELNIIEPLLGFDIDTITIPANSIKLVGETAVNELITWNFRTGKSFINSIQKPTENSYFEFYPNPASDKIILKTAENKPLSISIFNLNGIELIRKEMVNNETLSLSTLRKGLYLLRVNQLTQKLIVE